MPSTTVVSDLAQWGPNQAFGAPTLATAQRYCRRLARSHYENFTVASWLLPRSLRQHFYNVYAYCRWADDLSDEVGDATESLTLLDWWQAQLDACYEGDTRHPVFVALADTIRSFEIPADPFARLLTAFRQDQQQTRYRTFEDLLGYCRNSADPVGELVLYLGECHSQDNMSLSNSVCTGLQLANFWQDVARDFSTGRVYIPLETLDRFGYTEDMLANRAYNDAFCEVIKFEVDRAEAHLVRGRPLISQVTPRLRMSVAMFIGGGRAILERIRDLHYNVWQTRPTLTHCEKLRIAADAWRESSSQ
ncbi:MAG: squalene synthase HpnC [Pirellulales bacterium]|nr:squalene synthase HpnC [Pirellulales bacterium]